MKKLILLLLFIPLVFACSDDEDSTNPIDDTNPVYLDANGVTIKARDWAVVGDSGLINGVTYTIVDGATLRTMIENGDDVTRVCTSRIVNMAAYFYQLQDFNQNISSWDVSNVTVMDDMFRESYTFNQDISNWDVSNVTTMFGMFSNASSFNQPIGDWDVSNVTDMSGMFQFTESFNQPIGNWDVSNVTSIGGMFMEANFNQPIGNWDVSNVTTMVMTFHNALHFNQDISNWDVSNVTDMWGMFFLDLTFSDGEQSVFNQDLSSWNVSSVTACVNFNCFQLQNSTVIGGQLENWNLPKPNFTNCEVGCD